MTQFITLQIQDNIFMSFAVWPQDGPPAFRVPVRRLGHPAGVHPVRPLALLHTEGHLRHGRHGLLPGRLRPHHREHHAQVGEQSDYYFISLTCNLHARENTYPWLSTFGPPI